MDKNGAEPGLAHRNKKRLQFNEAGIAHADYQRNQSPLWPPAVAPAANTVKYGDTEDPKFRDVGRLSNSEMDQPQRVQAGRWQQPSQDRNDDVRGLIATESVGGEN